MKDLTEIKLKIIGVMGGEYMHSSTTGKLKIYKLSMGAWMPIFDTEWPHIVDEMIREKLPADKREEFLNRLNLRDPADHLLRFVVQHWWVKAEVYFELMK